jgi:hypothetical protein
MPTSDTGSGKNNGENNAENNAATASLSMTDAEFMESLVGMTPMQIIAAHTAREEAKKHGKRNPKKNGVIIVVYTVREEAKKNGERKDGENSNLRRKVIYYRGLCSIMVLLTILQFDGEERK